MKQALAHHRNAQQTMVTMVARSKAKAMVGQLISRLFSAWSHVLRLRKRRSEIQSRLKLGATSSRWRTSVTFRAWKLQIGTLRWRRCEDRWQGRRTTVRRLRRTWMAWRSLTLSSEVQRRRVREKQETKQAAKRLGTKKAVS